LEKGKGDITILREGQYEGTYFIKNSRVITGERDKNRKYWVRVDVKSVAWKEVDSGG